MRPLRLVEEKRKKKGKTTGQKYNDLPYSISLVVFCRWRQCAISCGHIGTLGPPGECDWTCASFGLPESTTQTGNRSVQPLLHSSRQKVPMLNNGRPFPKIAPSHVGLDPHLIHDSLGQSEPTVQTASRSVQPFSHRWPQSVPILYNGPPLHPRLKIAPSHGESGPQSNTWLPESTRVLNPNGISIGSSVFAGHTDRPTDWPTDRPTTLLGR